MVGLILWLLGLIGVGTNTQDVVTDIQDVGTDTRQEQQIIIQYNIEDEEYKVPTYKS
jgi:hypothetical protein